MPSEADAWQAAWVNALAAGDYLRALRLVRDAADDREPISYDVVAYLLQAVGRFEDADAVQRRRAELERARGLDALPAALRAAVQQASRTPPPEARQITLDEALEILPTVVAGHRVVIVGEEHHHPEHRAFGARVLGKLRTAGVTHLALETGPSVAPRTACASRRPPRTAAPLARGARDVNGANPRGSARRRSPGEPRPGGGWPGEPATKKGGGHGAGA